MKNSKKIFILTETVLAVLAILVTAAMLRGENQREHHKVSVIIQNSEDNQWIAFRYGLRMAAEDQEVEMSVVNTDEILTLEEESSIIKQELENGADGIILQPIALNGAREMLENIRKKVPVMLVESSISQDKDTNDYPVTQPDNYEIGQRLGEELLKDYRGNLQGKTLGILAETMDTEAAQSRKKGLRKALEGHDVTVRWNAFGVFGADGENSPETLPGVDIVLALDDASLTAAGECASANDLHGALVYGIGYSTEAAYYLDIGAVQCLLVPDTFNLGYQSLTQVSENLKNNFKKMDNPVITSTVIRRNTLFTKENQEILYTMSQ